MCLAVPAQLIETDGDEALADLHGNRIPVCTALVPGAQVGDWVLVHAGFAIQCLEPLAAKETWSVLRDLRAADETSPADGDPKP